MIKSRKMRWISHVARMQGDAHAKRPLGRRRQGGTVDLAGIGGEDVEWPARSLPGIALLLLSLFPEEKCSDLVCV
jgi:hypothetical protein